MLIYFKELQAISTMSQHSTSTLKSIDHGEDDKDDDNRRRRRIGVGGGEEEKKMFCIYFLSGSMKCA